MENMDQIISADTVAEKDFLGRNAFAGQIVHSLHTFFGDQKDSLVVGISGKWGTGKSTLLDYIKKQLDLIHQDQADRYKVLSFNSWGHTADNDLERSFLEKVVQAVSVLDWKDKAATANDKFKKYLGYLDYVKFAGHIHPMIKSVLDGAEEYRNKVDVVSLEEVRLEANRLLEESGIRLYILIDDLDRLTPKEITTLFRVLKVNLNLSNTIFVVAYDKQVVVQALEREYGVDGEKYLEKIIQVDFNIPQVSEAQIEELFFEKMSGFLSKIGHAFNRTACRSVWRIHGLKEYFRSVRDLNRYFNNLILSLPNIVGEVNLFDFLVLDAIKTFDAGAYHRMYGHIIEVFRKGIWESVSLDARFIERYEGETTRALLDYLFIRQYSDDGSGNRQRLREKEYFERYFALTNSPRVVIDEQLEYFFLKDTNKGIVLASALSTGRMDGLLDRLSDEKLCDSFSMDNNNIFGDFIDFFRSRYEPEDVGKGVLIVRTYFNLVRLFKDKHKAANAAIGTLILEKDKSDRIGFMFKHFLLKENEALNLPEQVSRYVGLNAGTLKENLSVYLRGHSNGEFFRISNDSGTWIDNLFLNDLAKDNHPEYLREFGERMYVKLIWFIISNNLIVKKDGELVAIKIKDVKLYFPKDVLAEVLKVIKNTERGHVRDNELEELTFFTDFMSQVS
jgi:hypothetical protein